MPPVQMLYVAQQLVIVIPAVAVRQWVVMFLERLWYFLRWDAG